jgi:uncharacterized protein YabN with tetrapyrrole methylase and pyrophosphatase domain
VFERSVLPLDLEEPTHSLPPRPTYALLLHELGDLLFAAVNVARLAGVDPELGLRAASARFRERVECAERLAADAGDEFASLNLEQQDAWYRRAKLALDGNG